MAKRERPYADLRELLGSDVLCDWPGGDSSAPGGALFGGIGFDLGPVAKPKARGGLVDLTATAQGAAIQIIGARFARSKG